MCFPTCREILMHQCITYCSFIKQSLSVPGLKRLSLFCSYHVFMNPLKHVSPFFSSASSLFLVSSPNKKRKQSSANSIPLSSVLLPQPNWISNHQIGFVHRMRFRWWKKFTCDCLPSGESGECEHILSQGLDDDPGNCCLY